MNSRRRWTILAVGTFAQAATCSFLYGVPMVVPALRSDGVGLLTASLLVSAPMAGLLLTLIAWGAAADRYGERLVMVLVLVFVADPQRPARPSGALPAVSPYRGASDLARVHLASAMLVVPQFAVATFTLVYLVDQRGWDPAAAGRLIFGFLVAGALGR